MTKRGYIFALILIGLVVFANSLFNNFVWDDEEQVLNNYAIRSVANIPQFFTGSTFNSGGAGNLEGLYYKPLMTTSFATIFLFFGDNPFFYHLIQLVLHLTNTIILFLIFRSFFKDKLEASIPFLLALIFLIHPSQVEAVSYVSGLQEPLFFLFGILAFWLFLSGKIKTIKHSIFLFFLLLFSMLSKETGFLFIVLICSYSFLFAKKSLKKMLLISVSSLSVYSFLRCAIAGIYFNKHGLTPISTLDFWQRILSLPKIMFFYIQSFFYPVPAISQHWVVLNVNYLDFYIPLIICISLSLILLLLFLNLYRRRSTYLKHFIFFLIWFLMGLGLHSQLIFPLDMTVSDRWFYFPLAGLLGLFSVLIIQFNLNKKLFLILLILWILFLSIKTVVRNSDWNNGLKLYSHDILYSKGSFDLENNLGVELFRSGSLDDAQIHFRNSTEIAPFWWTNWNNLGAIEESKGNFEKAIIYYQKAIDNGNYYLAYQNQAKMYFLHKTPQETKDFCENSLKILPANSSLWRFLALSEYRLGNREKALTAARNALYLENSSLNLYIYQRLSQNQTLEGI